MPYDSSFLTPSCCPGDPCFFLFVTGRGGGGRHWQDNRSGGRGGRDGRGGGRGRGRQEGGRGRGGFVPVGQVCVRVCVHEGDKIKGQEFTNDMVVFVSFSKRIIRSVS